MKAKKTALIIAAVISIALLISPVDLASGLHGDDIVYIITAIASILGCGKIQKNDSDFYYE